MLSWRGVAHIEGYLCGIIINLVFDGAGRWHGRADDGTGDPI
jgi:hypothetical protein